MAMLRFTWLPEPLALLLAVGACGSAVADPPAAPRMLMRLPGWIEAIGSRPAAETPPLTDVVAAPQAGAEILPVAAASGPPSTRRSAPASRPSGTAEAGPLQRWMADRVAQLPKPTTTDKPITTDEPATEDEPATDDRPADTAESVPAATPTAPVEATPQPLPPLAATADEPPALAVDPASFRDVHPGKTSRDELLAAWGEGEAIDRDDGTVGFSWKVEPFERVEVTLDGDTVAAILVKLAEPAPVAELARQLEIADIRTVTIFDEQGVAIGAVYPERGVILSVKPGTQSVGTIMIEPLDPESFVLRAEAELDSCSAYAVADLRYAIQLDPRHLRAHRMLLGITSGQGRWNEALQLAEAAVRLDPADTWIQLKHAGVLLALDRPAEARAVLEAVLGRENQPPLALAQAERLLGRVALAGTDADHQAAVQHFAEAIRRASPLLAKQEPAAEAAIREIMLDAHLGTALAIARGTWQQKSRVIPKWIARSEALVSAFTGSGAAAQQLELRLCRGVLATAADAPESVETLPWVKRMLELRDRMDGTVADPWKRRQFDWEVGQALADALVAGRKRGATDDLLDNATLTAAYLERGAEQRDLTATERKQMGELMFRIGIMHSLQRGDHATAVTWFDRTLPLWEENGDFDREGELGRLGESYVSMAISYWQVDRRDDALALSRRGVDLMVAAVDKSQLEERALAVAYGNLSTMYAEEGDDQQSKTYAEMASRAESSGTTLR